MTQPLCLIVSADADASLHWRRGLEPWGFRPYGVPHVDAAIGMLGQCRFDALLVDGDGDGDRDREHDVPGNGEGVRAHPLFGALPALSERTAAPILVVWSAEGDTRQIDALASGAADTVMKPASPRLVGAKLKRLVEIARDGGSPFRAAPPSRDIVYGPLRLDPARAVATCGGRALAFTAGEFALVAMLASRAGEVVERAAILRTLLEAGARPAQRETQRSADMHVCRIRRKLEAAGAATLGMQLATVHGRGYAFRVESGREPVG